MAESFAELSPFHTYTDALSDSGANLTAGPSQIATILKTLPITLSEPIIIKFGNKSTAVSRSYLDFPGTLLHRLYLLDVLPHCIISTSDLNLRGFELRYTAQLTCDVYNSTGFKLTSTPLNPHNLLYYFDVTALLIPVPTILPRQINAVRMEVLPRLTKQQISSVLDLHERLNHPGSAVMAKALANHAWIGIPNDITPALVERVFSNQACLSCHLGNARHSPHGPGTGAPYPYFGSSFSVDYVPVSVTALGGFTAFYLFRELLKGYVVVFLVKQKTKFMEAVNRTRAHFIAHGHPPLRLLLCDAGTVENSAASARELASLHISLDPAAPENQAQNPVERTVQTANHAISTMLLDQQFLGYDSWARAVLHWADTMNATPNVLSGEYSPYYWLCGTHPDLSRLFRFKFGQPVICPRLMAARKAQGFRFSPYGQLGFVIGSVGHRGDILVCLPDNKRDVDCIRSEAHPIRLFRTSAPNPLFASTVTYDSDGRLLFPDKITSHTIVPTLLVDSTPADELEMDSPAQRQTELLCSERTSNISDDLNTLMSQNDPDTKSTELAGNPPTSTELAVNPPTSAELAGNPPTTTKLVGNPPTSAELVGTPPTSAKLVGNPPTSAIHVPVVSNQIGPTQIPISVMAIDTTQSAMSPLRNFNTLYPRNNRSPSTGILNFLAQISFLAATLPEPTIDNPKYGAARKGPDYDTCWAPAVQVEMDKLRINNTGTPVAYEDIPPGHPIYPTKFDLKTKRDLVTGAVISFKARLCVMGNAFVDMFKALYAPTVKYASIMLLMALSMSLGLIIAKADISGAFLYPLINQDHPVYIMLPEKYTGKPKRVYWKLNKTLYGLPQSPEAFYADVSQHLMANGYQRTLADPCLFYMRDSDGNITLVSVHVDDFAIAGSNQQQVDQLVSVLRKRYTITLDASMESYVGIHMEYNRDGSVTMTQPNMIREIFRDYNCSPKAYRVPMDSLFNDADQDDSPLVDHIHYIRLLGRLMYLIRTRPDIAYALNRLATRTNRATEKDFKALLRVLLYVHHTVHLGLRFKRSPTSTENARRLFCFVDAAFATHTDSRSHTGYCFGMGDIAGMFFARSFKQSGVTLSSTESENWAAVEAVKEIIWFRELLAELGFHQTQPTTVYADNASMITLAEHFSGNHSKVKHFMLRVNFLIEKVNEGVIKFEHVRTEDNVADILTKPLGPIDFERLRPLLLGM